MKAEERKEWERQQRLQRILDLAKPLIFERGISNVTFEDVAFVTGYTKRSIYLYFNDKAELTAAIALEGIELLNQGLAQAVEQMKHEQVNIGAIARAFYDFSIKHPDYFHIFMEYEAKFFSITPPEGDDHSFKSKYFYASQTAAGYVKQGITIDKERGNITVPLDANQLMLLMWGQFYGVMHVILMRQQQFEQMFNISYQDLYAQFITMVARGVGLPEQKLQA